MLEAAQWQTPTPGRAEPLDLVGVEMNAVGEPGPPRHPAGLLQQLDRPHAVHRQAEALLVGGLAEMGVKLAVVALRRAAPSRASARGRSRTASTARARCGSARRAWDRGTASAPARCRRGSRRRPAPPSRAAGRRPSASGSSSRASPSCACRARAPPRLRCRRRSPGRRDRGNDGRRRWCSRRAAARPAPAAPPDAARAASAAPRSDRARSASRTVRG